MWCRWDLLKLLKLAFAIVRQSQGIYFTTGHHNMNAFTFQTSECYSSNEIMTQNASSIHPTTPWVFSKRSATKASVHSSLHHFAKWLFSFILSWSESVQTRHNIFCSVGFRLHHLATWYLRCEMISVHAFTNLSMTTRTGCGSEQSSRMCVC